MIRIIVALSVMCPFFFAIGSTRSIADENRFRSVFPEELHDRSYRAGDPPTSLTNEQDRSRLSEFWASLKHGPDVESAATETLAHFGGKLPIQFYGPDPRYPEHMDHIVIWDVYEDLSDIATDQNVGIVRYTIIQPQVDHALRNDRYTVDGLAIKSDAGSR